MASLDEFVKRNLAISYLKLKGKTSKKKQRRAEDSFDYSGGEAVIIDDKEKWQFIGMGIFATIQEMLDKPVNSKDSSSFRLLLERPQYRNEMAYHSGLLAQAIAEELITLTPLGEGYDRLSKIAKQLYEAYDKFENALPENIRKNCQFLPEIRARMKRVAESGSPEELMTTLFKDGSELAAEINMYLPAWPSNSWYIEMPKEFHRVEIAYHALRTAFREGEYQLFVSTRLRNAKIIKRIDIWDVPSERSYVFVVDTPEELAAFFNILNRSKANIVYRGQMNDETKPALERLAEKSFVACGNIMGHEDYKRYLISRQ